MSDAAKKDVNTLPVPFSDSWRQSFRYGDSDLPRLTYYQASGGQPIPFILETVKFSGGQAVDTAEFPSMGDWRNTPINNKVQTLTVTGFVRGEFYIKNRNELLAALKVNTSDDEPGYAELPTWGRFAVVVIDYSVDESADKNGQCAISITFNRAGISDVARAAEGLTETKDIKTAAANLKDKAVEKYAEVIEVAKDADTLAAGFSALKINLLKIIGVIQAPAALLNKLTGEVTQITNLIAQGVRAPKDLLLALFSAAGSIAAGIAEIKNAGSEYGTITNPFTVDNTIKATRQFLNNADYTIESDAITEKEQNTMRQTEQAFRAASLFAAATLLPENDGSTYEKAQELLTQYSRLEQSINQNDSDLYAAITDLRIAVTQLLAGQNLANGLQLYLPSPLPLLPLAHRLSCDEAQLRRLNDIADSFAVCGDVRYV